MAKKILLLIFICVATICSAQTVGYTSDSLTKLNVIKFEFFSPLTGNLTFGFERYLKKFMGIEAKIGIIGIGNQKVFDGKGAFVKVGPKFKLKPDFAVNGTFGTHLLRGSYIRPEIVFSAFKYQKDWYFDENIDMYIQGENLDVISGALMINYGKQHVLGDFVTLDYYMGIGYGFSNHDDEGYYYGYFAGKSNTPIAFNAGFTLGYIF